MFFERLETPQLRHGAVEFFAPHAGFMIVGVGLPDDPAGKSRVCLYAPAKPRRAVGDAGPYKKFCTTMQYFMTVSYD